MDSTKREPLSQRIRENAGEYKVHQIKVWMSEYEVQGNLRLHGELLKIPWEKGLGHVE